jgi:hypothetical protein
MSPGLMARPWRAGGQCRLRITAELVKDAGRCEVVDEADAVCPGEVREVVFGQGVAGQLRPN